MTEMIPTIIMALMHLLAAYGFYYFIQNIGDREYPFDLVVGFLTAFLLTVLAYQWYIGWNDYIGVYLTITSFYMAGFMTFAAIVMWFLEAAFLYKFIFKESRDVMP